MKKRILSVILCLVLVFSVISISAQARWTNCASISIGMSRSNGVVSWSGNIEGYSDTIKITANYVLEKLETNNQYTLVGTWSNLKTTTKTYLNSSGSASAPAGTYRLTLTGTVDTASYSEPISASLIKTF